MTDEMNDDTKSSAEGFWARLNHPVIGVFITSVIIWNWEIFYFLIRGLDKTQDTVEFVKQQYLKWGNWPNLFLWPLVITVAYLLSAPHLHEAYLNYKEWCREWAKKFKPITNLKYEKTNFAYEQKIKNLHELIEAEKLGRKDDAQIYGKNRSEFLKEMERLNGIYELTKGRPAIIDGIGYLEPLQMVKEISKRIKQNQEFQGRAVELQKQIAEKDSLIKKLQEKIEDFNKINNPQNG